MGCEGCNLDARGFATPVLFLYVYYTVYIEESTIWDVSTNDDLYGKRAC